MEKIVLCSDITTKLVWVVSDNKGFNEDFIKVR